MVESFAPRRLSVHQLFGGGNVADIVLWRKWSWSALVLISSTSIWLLFKSGEYNLMSFIVNVLLLLHIILFLWAKSASLLNRPLPVIPDLEISDSSVDKAVEVLRVWIDRTLWIASEISVSGNVQLLVQVAISLWIISVIGNLTDFITFVYILGSFLPSSQPEHKPKKQKPQSTPPPALALAPPADKDDEVRDNKPHSVPGPTLQTITPFNLYMPPRITYEL